MADQDDLEKEEIIVINDFDGEEEEDEEEEEEMTKLMTTKKEKTSKVKLHLNWIAFNKIYYTFSLLFVWIMSTWEYLSEFWLLSFTNQTIVKSSTNQTKIIVKVLHTKQTKTSVDVLLTR